MCFDFHCSPRHTQRGSNKESRQTPKSRPPAKPNQLGHAGRGLAGSSLFFSSFLEKKTWCSPEIQGARKCEGRPAPILHSTFCMFRRKMSLLQLSNAQKWRAGHRARGRRPGAHRRKRPPSKAVISEGGWLLHQAKWCSASTSTVTTGGPWPRLLHYNCGGLCN